MEIFNTILFIYFTLFTLLLFNIVLWSAQTILPCTVDYFLVSKFYWINKAFFFIETFVSEICLWILWIVGSGILKALFPFSLMILHFISILAYFCEQKPPNPGCGIRWQQPFLFN